MLYKTLTLVGVVLCATLATARADTVPDPEATPPPAAAAPAGGADQLTLPRGQLLLDAFAEINLSSGAVFKPFSLSPDLWYGATDDITVGLVHSGLGASGFIGAAGDALCLTGTSGNCGKLYPGVGLDVRYKLKTGDLAWAADGGLYARALDPFQLAIKLGIAGRWHSSQLAVELLPNLFLGLTNRSPATPAVVPGMMAVAVVTNQEVLSVPVTGLYSLTPQLALALQLGVVLPLENLGDGYAIPLSIGGHYQATENLSLNLAFSLPRLVAKAPSGFDVRTLTLGGTYAF